MNSKTLIFVITIFILSTSSLYAIAITDGLIAHWSGEISGESALDQSGNGHHGTLSNGAQNAPGIFGNSFAFDGANDVVIVQDNNSLDFSESDSFTISAWVQTTRTSEQRVIGKQTGAGQNGVYVLDLIDNGRLRFFLRDNNGVTAGLFGSENLADGQIHHIAGVRDVGANNIRFYVDGQLRGTTGDNTTIFSTSIDVLIGKFTTAASGGSPFSGLVDDVAIYNRALSSTELSTLHDNNLVPEANTLALLSIVLFFSLLRKNSFFHDGK